MTSSSLYFLVCLGLLASSASPSILAPEGDIGGGPTIEPGGRGLQTGDVISLDINTLPSRASQSTAYPDSYIEGGPAITLSGAPSVIAATIENVVFFHQNPTVPFSTGATTLTVDGDQPAFVSICDTKAVVGDGATSVFVVMFDDAQTKMDIVPPEAVTFTTFGRSATFFGNDDMLAVGATTEDGRSFVYIYELVDGESWQERDNVVRRESSFGSAMAGSDTVLVIATPESSKVEVYGLDRTGDAATIDWLWEETSTAESFGSAVAVLGDSVVVGGPLAENGAGGLWVFGFNDGVLSPICEIISASENQRLADSVAVKAHREGIAVFATLAGVGRVVVVHVEERCTPEALLSDILDDGAEMSAVALAQSFVFFSSPTGVVNSTVAEKAVPPVLGRISWIPYCPVNEAIALGSTGERCVSCSAGKYSVGGLSECTDCNVYVPPNAQYMLPSAGNCTWECKSGFEGEDCGTCTVKDDNGQCVWECANNFVAAEGNCCPPKPATARWSNATDCSYSCYDTFFGEHCLLCSAYMAGSPDLPGNAVWVDHVSSCYFACQTGYAFNASTANCERVHCSDKTSCAECASSPNCAWCTNEDVCTQRLPLAGVHACHSYTGTCPATIHQFVNTVGAAVAAFIGTLLLCIVFCFIVRRSRDRLDYDASVTHIQSRANAMRRMQHVLTLLGSQEYRKDETVVKHGQPSCCICLVDFENGIVIRTLPCDHVFHQDCIDSWFKTSNQSLCPMCKVDVADKIGVSANPNTWTSAPRMQRMQLMDPLDRNLSTISTPALSPQLGLGALSAELHRLETEGFNLNTPEDVPPEDVNNISGDSLQHGMGVGELSPQPLSLYREADSSDSEGVNASSSDDDPVSAPSVNENMSRNEFRQAYQRYFQRYSERVLGDHGNSRRSHSSTRSLDDPVQGALSRVEPEPVLDPVPVVAPGWQPQPMQQPQGLGQLRRVPSTRDDRQDRSQPNDHFSIVP